MVTNGKNVQNVENTTFPSPSPNSLKKRSIEDRSPLLQDAETLLSLKSFTEFDLHDSQIPKKLKNVTIWKSKFISDPDPTIPSLGEEVEVNVKFDYKKSFTTPLTPTYAQGILDDIANKGCYLEITKIAYYFKGYLQSKRAIVIFLGKQNDIDVCLKIGQPRSSEIDTYKAIASCIVPAVFDDWMILDQSDKIKKYSLEKVSFLVTEFAGYPLDIYPTKVVKSLEIHVWMYLLTRSLENAGIIWRDSHLGNLVMKQCKKQHDVTFEGSIYKFNSQFEMKIIDLEFVDHVSSFSTKFKPGQTYIYLQSVLTESKYTRYLIAEEIKKLACQ